MKKSFELQQELMSQFRESRNQIQKSVVDKHMLPSRGLKSDTKPKISNYYNSYLIKAKDLESNVTSFSTRDIVYHFRELANNSGTKYVIANIQKDLVVIKRCLNNYTVPELVLMMEFLFTSEQDYLDTSDLQITILQSSFCNTIYKDSVLWANDEYVVKSKRKAKAKFSDREYPKKNITKSSTSIGVWDLDY